MYRLYGRPGTGSVTIEAILETVGEPYEVEHVPRSPGGEVPDVLVRLNPLGQVPVLRLPDGEIMTESAAIALYLADKHPKAELAPLPGSTERAAGRVEIRRVPVRMIREVEELRPELDVVLFDKPEILE